ncbi:MAG: integrase core domain-containing protein [bacterium]|nr:integrase core domain-containing protein [bacterium]
MPSSKGEAVQELIVEAIEKTGMLEVPRHERVQLLSDNASCYIWGPFNEYLKTLGIKHIFSQRNHPQTNGKACPERSERIERLNRTTKEKVMLIVQASPEEFDRALEAFQRWYNYEHYHEGIGNLHPADVYFGRADAILTQRKQLKEQTKKARKRANLTPTKNPRKKRNLRAKTLQ